MEHDGMSPARLPGGQERNYGVDALRVVAMLYVVVLHTLGNGGALATPPGTAQYNTLWLLEVWAFAGVDIFALISGYVGAGRSPGGSSGRLARYLTLWLQVALYNVAATAVLHGIYPDRVPAGDILSALFPVSSKGYWYFTAYSGLFLLMPFLDAGARNCSPRTARKVFFGLLALFCLLGDRFKLGGGYSFAWLAILYAMGGAMRRGEVGRRLKAYQALLGAAVCTAACWLWRLYGVRVALPGIAVTPEQLVSYTSPFVVGAAALHLIGFSKLRFPRPVQRVVAFGAAGAFAAYLLNDQRYIASVVLRGRFASLATHSPLSILARVWVYAAVFVAASILIDHLRMLLFRLLRVHRGMERISALIDRLLGGPVQRSQ